MHVREPVMVMTATVSAMAHVTAPPMVERMRGQCPYTAETPFPVPVLLDRFCGLITDATRSLPLCTSILHAA